MRILTGFTLFMAASLVQAADYKIDNTHSFVQFRTPHLGYSWLYGRFDVVGGEFVYDSAHPERNRIHVTVNVASLDSNHQQRDEHLHEKHLKTAEQPQAEFTSDSYEGDASGGSLKGELLLNGVKKMVVIPVKKIGEGPDPWGGNRVGFEGALIIDTRDYGYTYKLGEHSYKVELQLGIEGVRQDPVPHKKS